jgi:hypothetical protein
MFVGSGLLAMDAQHLVCVPLPFSDQDLCFGLNTAGIAFSVFLVVCAVFGALARSNRGWSHSSQLRGTRESNQTKPLYCSGQYGSERHERIERVVVGSVPVVDGAPDTRNQAAVLNAMSVGRVLECPTCGHRIVD